MNKKTLIIIQAPYSNLAKVWSELYQFALVDDPIVIMGEALLTVPDEIFNNYRNIYCLDSDVNLLNQTNHMQIKILQYSDFADLILEFNVIDCSSEKSISEYSAVQTCTYEFKNDTLKIFELKLLPSGKNWKWQFEKISVEIFTLKNNKIIKIPPKPIFYVDIQMSDFEQNEFINDIILNKDNGLQYDWEWEEIIGKLELLSLIKNQKALEILLNLEKITNYQLDGAFKEQYNDAVSNVNWILNN